MSYCNLCLLWSEGKSEGTATQRKIFNDTCSCHLNQSQLTQCWPEHQHLQGQSIASDWHSQHLPWDRGGWGGGKRDKQSKMSRKRDGLTELCWQRNGVVAYLSPLFGLYALGVQHNHWEVMKKDEIAAKREEKCKTEEYVTKQSQSRILPLQIMFVLFLLCWHSWLIILPRPDNIMNCQAWWF